MTPFHLDAFKLPQLKEVRHRRRPDPRFHLPWFPGFAQSRRSGPYWWSTRWALLEKRATHGNGYSNLMRTTQESKRIGPTQIKNAPAISNWLEPSTQVDNAINAVLIEASKPISLSERKGPQRHRGQTFRWPSFGPAQQGAA
jgi:hypothetical protein